MNRETRHDQLKINKSLISLVKGLENQVVTVDLRNESCLTGKILNTDAAMNLEMENVEFYDPTGRRHFFENFFVQTRNIRYIHLPDNIEPEVLITTYFNSLKPKSFGRGTRPKTFKAARAQKYQTSLLQELSQPSTSSGSYQK